MQWSIARHIENNINRLQAALDEAETKPDLEGHKVRRAVMHITGATSSKVGHGITFVHVRHFPDHELFLIQIKDVSIQVDTVEEVEEWVRREFDILAEPWRPEWI